MYFNVHVFSYYGLRLCLILLHETENNTGLHNVYASISHKHRNKIKCSYEQIRHNYNKYLLNTKTYSLFEMITLLSILKTAILYYNFDSEFTKVSLNKMLFCFRI